MPSIKPEEQMDYYNRVTGAVTRATSSVPPFLSVLLFAVGLGMLAVAAIVILWS